jgi:hypothetical protein
MSIDWTYFMLGFILTSIGILVGQACANASRN